jgi:hypothetical protein
MELKPEMAEYRKACSTVWATLRRSGHLELPLVVCWLPPGPPADISEDRKKQSSALLARRLILANAKVSPAQRGSDRRRHFFRIALRPGAFDDILHSLAQTSLAPGARWAKQRIWSVFSCCGGGRRCRTGSAFLLFGKAGRKSRLLARSILRRRGSYHHVGDGSGRSLHLRDQEFSWVPPTSIARSRHVVPAGLAVRQRTELHTKPFRDRLGIKLSMALVPVLAAHVPCLVAPTIHLWAQPADSRTARHVVVTMMCARSSTYWPKSAARHLLPAFTAVFAKRGVEAQPSSVPASSPL